MKLNLDLIDQVGASLHKVHQDFTDAEKLTDDWRGMVGHPGLADQLDEFSGNWNDTRDNMLESIKSMGEVACAIADAFREADRELAKCLEEAE